MWRFINTLRSPPIQRYQVKVKGSFVNKVVENRKKTGSLSMASSLSDFPPREGILSHFPTQMGFLQCKILQHPCESSNKKRDQ